MSAMKQKAKHVGKSVFWFIVGASLGLFFSLSFIIIIFQQIYGNYVYPGIHVVGHDVGGKTQQQVKEYLIGQNTSIAQTQITFSYQNQVATVSAQQLQFGYNADLLADQAYVLGRSPSLVSNISQIVGSYMYGINLPASYSYSDDALRDIVASFSATVKKDPVDGLFTFSNNKVTAFQLSKDGQDVDIDALRTTLENQLVGRLMMKSTEPIHIDIPVKVIKPRVSTDGANNLGIKELIGHGTSLYYHSIPNRIYNISLATSKLNGVLIAPGEEFSFAKTVGDISAQTGYQQAYVISGGRTILGDGGGVCQVSTTLFRAALDAGLPINERHPHDYRVGYYEEDGPPGIDAAVNVPTVDLKFTNNTGHWILIQATADTTNMRLTFDMYGTSDGRKVSMTTPVVTGQAPPPPDLYVDDPTLAKGVLKQVDFSAWGAHVSFSRTVTRGNDVLAQDTFVSNYRPWQAIYMRGTKE